VPEECRGLATIELELEMASRKALGRWERHGCGPQLIASFYDGRCTGIPWVVWDEAVAPRWYSAPSRELQLQSPSSRDHGRLLRGCGTLLRDRGKVRVRRSARGL